MRYSHSAEWGSKGLETYDVRLTPPCRNSSAGLPLQVETREFFAVDWNLRIYRHFSVYPAGGGLRETPHTLSQEFPGPTILTRCCSRRLAGARVYICMGAALTIEMDQLSLLHTSEALISFRHAARSGYICRQTYIHVFRRGERQTSHPPRGGKLPRLGRIIYLQYY